MAKKKKKPVLSTSQVDTAQVHEILERYHQAASLLRKTTSRKQAEEALGEINGLPEAAQVALAKALAREQSRKGDPSDFATRAAVASKSSFRSSCITTNPSTPPLMKSSMKMKASTRL